MTTLLDIKEFLDDPAYDFHVDMEVALNEISPTEPLKDKQSIPLICKRKKLNSNEDCLHRVRHTVSNIKSLKNNPRHIVCQGPCDSKNKGKSRRKGNQVLRDLLEKVTNGEWRFLDTDHDGRIKVHHWFIHHCGFEVYRVASSVINDFSYEQTSHCPLCERTSPFNCINKDVNLYNMWLAHVTNNKLSLTENIFPASADAIPVTCDCGNSFTEKQSNILRYEHCGCNQCQQNNNKSQKAFQISEAMELLHRRGFHCTKTPVNYIDPVKMTTAQNETITMSVLAVCKELQATKTGYGITSKPKSSPMKNNGQRWSKEDDLKLCELNSKKARTEVAEELERSVQSVSKRVQTLGQTDIYGKTDKRKYKLRDNAFTKITCESAKWAGLIAADGCVTDKSDIKIELKAIDETILVELMNFLDQDWHLRYRTMKNIHGRGIYASLQFRSVVIAKDLKKIYHITPRKSLTLMPPGLVRIEHKMAYLVGMIEGDGSISFASKRNSIKMTLATGSKKIHDWTSKTLQEFFGREVQQYSDSRNENIRYLTSMNRSQTIKFYLYVKQFVDVSMMRKWNKIEKFIKNNPKIVNKHFQSDTRVSHA